MPKRGRGGTKKKKRTEIKKIIDIRKIKINKREIGILATIIVALFLLNYTSLDNTVINFFNTNQEIHVDRVIDGDTIENNGTSIRLLGINTPERGEFFYEQAKDFLRQEIQGKNVTLEFVGDRYDKYQRTLAYVFFNNTNINVKMVEQGFANYYFYSGKDKYSGDLLDAWGKCINNKINLCEPSNNRCTPCIKIDSGSITNSCSFNCNITNWEVKGEGREKFIFSEKILHPNEKTMFALDLTNTGGSLFLRDDEGKLVGWKTA